MVEGGMKCIKFLLFAFNLIFVIVAIAIIAAGAYVQFKLVEYYDFFGNQYTGPGILLIVVGVFIFIIAFFGCMGALKENYCLTMSFAVLLAVIFILLIAGGIAGFVLRTEIEESVSDALLQSEQKYNNTQGVKDTWDKLQIEFACCGVKNASEWELLNITFSMGGNFPSSCCAGNKSPCNSPISQPCETAFIGWLKDQVAIIGGVGIGLAFIMVVGVLFACCLARAIRKEYEVV